MMLLLCIHFVEAQETPFLVVGGDSVSQAEFSYAYRKNLSYGGEAERLSLDSFLVSYTNFRLKVCDAKAHGMDRSQRFKEEYQKYRDYQLSPFLIDSAQRDEIYREAYSRMQREVDASHILIGISKPEEAAEALALAIRLRRELQDGALFDSLARIYSTDPSVKINGGRLGFFGPFSMVYPFETAAYHTGLGSVSDPVRTQFGYHLVRVNGTRPARGAVRVAHIMKIVAQGMDSASEQRIQQKMDALHKRLENGADFAALARQESEDASSAKEGGELPEVVTGRFPSSFEEECFRLKADGEISPVFRTPYGYHIVKCLGRKPVPNYEEAKDYIRQRLVSSGVKFDGKDVMWERLRRKMNATVDKEVLLELARACARLDTLSLQFFSPKLKQRSFAHIGMQGYPVSDLILNIKGQIGSAKFWTLPLLEEAAVTFVNERALALLLSSMERDQEDIVYLLREFYNGLLLFDISEKRLWNPSPSREKAMKRLYRKNRRHLRFPLRYTVEEYFAKDSSTLVALQPKICARRKDGIGRRALKRDSILRVTQHYDASLPLFKGYVKAEREESGEGTREGWHGECSAVRPVRKGYMFYKVVKEKPNARKSYEEAKGELQSSYEAQAEREWMDSLRVKFPVTIDPRGLRELRKHLPQ